MPKILNIGQSRQTMAEFFCDIEILRNEGEFEARVEGLTPNVMSLKLSLIHISEPTRPY